jgi:flagella basal body P-ring formation protein FlgA
VKPCLKPVWEWWEANKKASYLISFFILSLIFFSPVYGEDSELFAPISTQNVQMNIEKMVKAVIISKYPYTLAENVAIRFVNLDRLTKSIPPDAVGFKINLNNRSKFLGKNVIRITFFHKDGYYIGHFSVYAIVKAEAGFIKSTRALRAGEIFKKEDLKTELLELYNKPNNVVTEIDRIVGKEAAFDVASDVLIIKWMIKPVPVIRKNDIVSVRNTNKAVTVEMRGIALEDGEVGDQIQVRIESTRRIFTGEVVSTGNVEIK